MQFNKDELIVYTVLIGSNEGLNNQPFIKYSNYRHVCLTDNKNLKSKDWEIITVDPIFPQDSNRSQRYLDEVHNFNINFNYHSYRNSSINLLLPAAQMLTEHGYHVLRVGHLVGDKVISSNKKIIDYDNEGYRTEFLDVYLASKCEYIFGTDTGYFAIPGWNFRKPILYVNFSQFEYLYSIELDK